MSFCPASIAALRPVDRRLAGPAHVTRFHAPEALELSRREKGTLAVDRPILILLPDRASHLPLIFLATVSG